MEKAIAWILLSRKNRTGKKMEAIRENFDNLMKTVDFTSPEAIKLKEGMEKTFNAGYGFITYIDEDYPEMLRNISNPPAYLFLRGDRSLLNYPVKAAIVGSRNATPYGMNIAADFAHEMAGGDVCIVTGGARGIDTAAIRGAMRKGCRVIIAIGTGIDRDYPAENAPLFEKVSREGGLIISEFPLGTGPLAHNFPIRNRIVTALSDSVVVVEAAERSGALITARCAIEQGKLLCAVPGNIDSPNSKGTNMLLRDGAMFAMSGGEITEEMKVKFPEKFEALKNAGKETSEKPSFLKEEGEREKCASLTPDERAVINALKSGKETYEEILSFTLMEAKKLTSLLTIMEIKGIIKLAFRNKYKLND